LALLFALVHTKASQEEIAQKLLDSNIFRGVKSIEDARIVTAVLLQAYENYTFSPEPHISEEPFTCTPTGKSFPTPTNARRLKPADIELVIGIGDSLTAAFGADATSIFDLFTDYRASSFSSGINENFFTFPKCIQTFNPAVSGYSVGDGDENSANARLNVAVTGAISEELVPQVNHLVEKLSTLNNSKAWKHITLFIGGNDLCDSCNEPARYSPERYNANIQAALDAIFAQITNAFISVVVPPDVTLLAELPGFGCAILRPFECSCNGDIITKDLHRQYILNLHQIETLAKYNQREDMFVVVQPFLELIELPTLDNGEIDMSYFAPDCFHFSDKAHGAAGLSLWNNLMEVPIDKKRTWVVGEPYECPGPDQWIQ